MDHPQTKMTTPDPDDFVPDPMMTEYDTISDVAATEDRKEVLKRRLTREDYLKAEKSYLAIPGDHKQAAAYAKISEAAAERAYEDGWRLPNCPPIKIKVDGVQKVALGAHELARKRQQEKILEMETATFDAATKAKFEEAAVLQVGRKNAHDIMGSLAVLQKPIRTLATRVAAQLEASLSNPGAEPKYDIQETIKILKDFGQATNAVTTAAQRLVETQRLLLGEHGGKAPVATPLTKEDVTVKAIRGLQLIRGGDEQMMEVSPVAFGDESAG